MINWCRRVCNLIIALSLVLLSLGTPGTTDVLASSKFEPKANPRLLQMAADYPTYIFKVIVQKDEKIKELHILVMLWARR